MKFDITEAFIQALQEQESIKEARSHKEDNEKAAPRDTGNVNGVYKNKYKSSQWQDADIKRNRVSSKDRAEQVDKDLDNNFKTMSDTEFESDWKKRNDMRYEPAEYDLNKDSRAYKDAKNLAKAYSDGKFGPDEKDNADIFNHKADEIVANRRAKHTKTESKKELEEKKNYWHQNITNTT